MFSPRARILAMIVLACCPVGAVFAQGTARIQEGQQVFVRWCEGCHARGNPVQKNPNGAPVGRIWAGTHTLEERYKGAVPAALEDRVNLTPELIRMVVRNGLNVMPRTRKTEISDDKLDALIAYLTRNNAAGK
jgi:(+)-pinoresinol hydroxylase